MSVHHKVPRVPTTRNIRPHDVLTVEDRFLSDLDIGHTVELRDVHCHCTKGLALRERRQLVPLQEKRIDATQAALPKLFEEIIEVVVGAGVEDLDEDAGVRVLEDVDAGEA